MVLRSRRASSSVALKRTRAASRAESVIRWGDSLQAAVVLFEHPLGAIAGADQWTGDHFKEAFFQSDFAESPKLFRGHVTVDRQMVDRRAEVLAEGHDVDADGAEIVHALDHFVVGLAEPQHQTGLGQD